MISDALTLGSRFRMALVLALLGGVMLLPEPLVGTVRADIDERTVPSIRYQAVFRMFHDGEYKDALAEFSAEGRGGIKIGQVRWIDSICYHTMIGECHYHMGQLPEALEHYTAALNIFTAFSDWMIRVQLPPAIRAASTTSVRPIPWGQSTRRARRGYYPASVLFAQGRIDNNPQFRQGGVVQQALLRPIQAQEIVRSTTLAIRRRTELMGLACRHDELTSRLIAALSSRPGAPNHWSEAWIDVQLGLAMEAGGKLDQAVLHLQRAVVAAGEFDHPLTGTALLELGRLAMARGDYAAASKLFAEATYTSVHYPNAGVLEEAFRFGALAHLLDSRKGIYPPLAQAIRWAKVNNLRQLQVSLLLCAAENYAVLGQTREAAAFLADAQAAIGRRWMANGWIGARLRFLNALVLFQQRQVTEGDQALASAMSYMRHGSHRVFQISLADKLYTSGRASARVAMDLYEEVLHDPLAADWSADPMESLAVLLIPHPAPLEHWFEVAMGRKEYEKALEITDRARRHRFFSSLAFGGRLQSLRWVLEGPDEALDPKTLLHRQDLRNRYPAYHQLSQQARQIREKLAAQPLVAEAPAVFQRQSQELGQLATLSLQQEAILREMAVRREPAGMVFPPLRSTKLIQKAIPDGHALLVFFATGRHLYGFLLNSQRYTYWQVGSPAKLSKQIAGLLRQMGNFEQNRQLGLKELADQRWRASAQELLTSMLKGSRVDFSKQFDELIIVPDGVLWYVPFEALQVSVKGASHSLIDRFRIRYAPTMSLAVADGRGRPPAGNTAVVVGHLFPRDDEQLARDAFEQLAGLIPGTVALKSPLPAPSAIYSTLFDRLIVLDDVDHGEHGPYSWSPMGLDRGKPGSTLDDWLSLPWGGPEQIVLPGFHTAAENALKRADPIAPGADVFLSICGLMSSGARTLLISRWRTGGQTSFELVREFTQELPHTPASDAWQRAVLLAKQSRVDVDLEPRVKQNSTEAPPLAEHPFFWSGYMLIDSGTPMQAAKPKPDQPALKIKKPQPRQE